MERQLAEWPALPRKQLAPSGVWIKTTAFRQIEVAMDVKFVFRSGHSDQFSHVWEVISELTVDVWTSTLDDEVRVLVACVPTEFDELVRGLALSLGLAEQPSTNCDVTYAVPYPPGSVTAVGRKLSASWALELAQDARAIAGLDIEVELMIAIMDETCKSCGKAMMGHLFDDEVRELGDGLPPETAGPAS